MYLGDVLVQLCFFALMLVAILSLFRSSKKRRIQLQRIEEKIDHLHEHITNSNPPS